MWGSSLKKEVNAITNLSLELPQSNGLRKTLGEYKTRFEDAIDEFLGFYTWDPWCHEEYVIVPVSIILALRLKGITTDANLADLKDELDSEAMQLRADIPILPHMPSIFNLKSNIIKSCLYMETLNSVKILWHQS